MGRFGPEEGKGAEVGISLPRSGEGGGKGTSRKKSGIRPDDNSRGAGRIPPGPAATTDRMWAVFYSAGSFKSSDCILLIFLSFASASRWLSIAVAEEGSA